jgi:hypothetical protein
MRQLPISRVVFLVVPIVLGIGLSSAIQAEGLSKQPRLGFQGTLVNLSSRTVPSAIGSCVFAG